MKIGVPFDRWITDTKLDGWMLVQVDNFINFINHNYFYQRSPIRIQEVTEVIESTARVNLSKILLKLLNINKIMKG